MAHGARACGVCGRVCVRTGFQGALQTYRAYADLALNAELRLFASRAIDVLSLFIGGTKDWATYSAPGSLQLMKSKATTKNGYIEWIEGAEHWIQQEQPGRVSSVLLAFMKNIGGANRPASLSTRCN